jgi:hypothetical protein
LDISYCDVVGSPPFNTDREAPVVDPGLEKAPGLGVDVAILAGDIILALDCSDASPLPDGVVFKMELMDETRLNVSSRAFVKSASVDENDRLRDGERNDAGESDDCLSAGIAIEVSGASRLSLVKDSGMSRPLLG